MSYEWIGAAISAIGGIVGQNRANAANANLNDENRSFNSAEAAIARDWSNYQADVQRGWTEHMSNTSYQRAVNDLHRAGLNPMLAYSQGGAPTGSGATATGPAASAGSGHRMENSTAKGIDAMLSAIQLSNLAKQGQNIDADTELKRAQAHQSSNSAVNLAATTESIITGVIPKLRSEINEIQTRTHTEALRQPLVEAQTLLTKTAQLVEAGKIEQVEADVALKKVQTLLENLRVPEAKAYSEKFSGDYGKNVTPYMREALDVLRTLIYSRPR